MLTIHPGLDRTQKRIVRPPSNIVVVDHKACRRYGKSHSAKAIIIDQAVGAGKRVLYMTPSASQFEAMYNFFANESVEMRARHANYGCKLQPTPHLTFISGGYVEFRSLEVLANARGGEWDVIIIDEQQDLKCTFEQFTAVVNPMLANRFGRLYFFGQFAGKNWQFQKYFVPGVPRGELYHDPVLWTPERNLSIRSPWQEALFFKTNAGRAWLDQDRKLLLPAVFKQEYECICLDSGSGVFEHVDHILGGESHKYPYPGEVYYIFWDPGKVADPAGVVVLAKYAGIICNAFALDIGMNYIEQLEWVRRQGAFYAPNVCYGIDVTSGGTQSGAIEDFARPILKNVYPVSFNQYAKEDYIKRAQIEMQQRHVLVPHEHEDLISQLRRYTYDRDPETGRYCYHAPVGEHDDLVAGFIGALHMRAQNWGPVINGRSYRQMAA